MSETPKGWIHLTNTNRDLFLKFLQMEFENLAAMFPEYVKVPGSTNINRMYRIFTFRDTKQYFTDPQYEEKIKKVLYLFELYQAINDEFSSSRHYTIPGYERSASPTLKKSSPTKKKSKVSSPTLKKSKGKRKVSISRSPRRRSVAARSPAKRTSPVRRSLRIQGRSPRGRSPRVRSPVTSRKTSRSKSPLFSTEFTKEDIERAVPLNLSS